MHFSVLHLYSTVSSSFQFHVFLFFFGKAPFSLLPMMLVELNSLQIWESAIQSIANAYELGHYYACDLNKGFLFNIILYDDTLATSVQYRDTQRFVLFQ